MISQELGRSTIELNTVKECNGESKSNGWMPMTLAYHCLKGIYDLAG